MAEPKKFMNSCRIFKPKPEDVARLSNANSDYVGQSSIDLEITLDSGEVIVRSFFVDIFAWKDSGTQNLRLKQKRSPGAAQAPLRPETQQRQGLPLQGGGGGKPFNAKVLDDDIPF